MPSGHHVSVRLPTGMLAEVDHHRHRRGMTRNAFLVAAVRRILDGEEGLAPSGLPRSTARPPGRPPSPKEN